MSELTVASLLLALALAFPLPVDAQSENSQITGFASIPWGADSTAIESEYGTATSATSGSDTTWLDYDPHELLGTPAKMTFILVRDSLVAGEYRLNQGNEQCLGSFRAVTAAISRANPKAAKEPEKILSLGGSTARKSESTQCAEWTLLAIPLLATRTFRDPSGSAVIDVQWFGSEERTTSLVVNYRYSDPLDEKVRRAFGPP